MRNLNLNLFGGFIPISLTKYDITSLLPIEDTALNNNLITSPFL